VEDLSKIIGYGFACRELLQEALTHPSALVANRRGRSRKPVKRSYERLEFLGDRVLGLVVALARVAEAIELGPHLVLSRAEAAAGAAGNPGILADACEALIASIFVDGGFAAASSFVRRFWEPLIDEMEEPPRDPKTALQEWAQARGLALPAYELVSTSGPDHSPLFTVAASVAGGDRATATASSKRAAEARAAACLLNRLVTEPQ
jgi:ribonuclease-3